MKILGDLNLTGKSDEGAEPTAPAREGNKVGGTEDLFANTGVDEEPPASAMSH